MIALLLLLPPNLSTDAPLVDNCVEIEFNRYSGFGHQAIFHSRRGPWVAAWRAVGAMKDLQRHPGYITFSDGGVQRKVYATWITDSVTPDHDPERLDWQDLCELNRQRVRDGKVPMRRIGLSGCTGDVWDDDE
jgi:hypothetical protein